MELLTQRLASLLTVKSLVTVILTAVFAGMAGTSPLPKAAASASPSGPCSFWTSWAAAWEA